MQKVDATARSKPAASDVPLLQRKCDCAESGKRCERCGGEEPTVQRKAANTTATAQQGASAPSVHNVLQSSGQPLDRGTRAFMESRFDHDFSHVRVHADAAAAESARAVHAQAYASGNHVVFGPGQFRPSTPAGRRLLAHELAHTIQQQSGIGASELTAERDADAAAASIESGTRAKVTSRAAPGIARQVVPPGQDTERDKVLATAARTKSPLRNRAWEVVWTMLKRYFPEYVAHVSAVRYEENAPSARADIKDSVRDGKKVQSAVVIVGKKFVESTNDDDMRARITELGTSLGGLVADPDPQAASGSTGLWATIHKVVPKKGARIAGASYDANLPDPPGLLTEFGSGSVAVGAMSAAWSGPKLYFGKAFLALPSADQEQRVRAEFEKIDRWAVANARLTKVDLDDEDITLRIRGLPVADLIKLRDKVVDPKVKEYVATLVGTSTPLEEGLAAGAGGLPTLTIGNVTVVVSPDLSGATLAGPNAADTGQTSSDVGVTWGGFSHDGTRVTRFDPPPARITITIQTRYRTGASASDSSGYGRGTTAADQKAEGKNLRVHEGSHGLDFIRFIKSTPFPTFTGRVGMTIAAFTTARDTFRAQRTAWFNRMTRASELGTDCVGITIQDYYTRRHQVPPVRCP
jgi:hypothetical protein